MTVLRHLLLIALAAILSWFVLLRAPSDARVAGAQPMDTNDLAAPDLKLAVRPRIEEQDDPVPPQEEQASAAPAVKAESGLQADEDPTPVPEEQEVVEAEPPAAERGAPDGAEEGELPPPAGETSSDENEMASSAETSTESPAESGLEAEPSGSPRASFLADEELLDEARRELSGETRVGFETRILSAPEDQLEIARSFGGEIVLVPRTAIDPSKDSAQAVWFRIRPGADSASGGARVERVVGPPELANWTRYRDLFDYEYARLPKAVRDLRRSVLSRAEIFLFAGLISAREWALVVGRRTEALNRAGRRPDELRRATLRTIRTRDGFDFRVESLEYAQESQN